MHPDFPRSHWAIQEIAADTESFVSLLCTPLVVPRQKGSGEKKGNTATPPPGETLKMISATLGVEILVNSTEN